MGPARRGQSRRAGAGKALTGAIGRRGLAWAVRLLLASLLLAAPAAAAPSLVRASGQWAALREGPVCEAATLGLREATTERPRARASVAFDARRHGELAIHLPRAQGPGSAPMLVIGDQRFLLAGAGEWAWSRGAAQEMAIITALRTGGGMRIEARSAGGGRMVERFASDGAPTAIDAAAACAAAI